jgi:serine O-acetyltransferase
VSDGSLPSPPARSPSAPARAPLPFISPLDADWAREAKRFWQWDPGRSLLASLRAHERALRGAPIARVVRRRIAVLRHRFWSVVTGADIPLGSRIGGGLLLPHPNGVVIHPEATVGPNCLLFQQVTLGNGGARAGAPTLAGHVDVGAGAKILGGVTIGEHAMIGANAVVLCDVPARMIAVGVPARILPRGTGLAPADGDG